MRVVLLEARATLRQRHVAIGAVVYTVAILLASIRKYSAALSLDPSVPVLATEDNRTRYLALVAAALAGAESGAGWYATRRATYAWVAGVTHPGQLARRVGAAAVLGAAAAASYWVLRTAAGAVTLVTNDRPVVLVSDGPLAVDGGAVWRLAGAAIAAAVVGALAGCALRRPFLAGSAVLALAWSLTPIVGPVATRVPAIVSIQSYLPGGALTTLLESNRGIAREYFFLPLRSPRSAFLGAAILAIWAGAFCALALAGGVHRTAGPPASGRARVGVTAGAALAFVVVVAAVLPPLAREAFPWYLQPEWLEAKREHRSSMDVVRTFTDALRSGSTRALAATLPEGAALDASDPFWQPLVEGDLTIGPQSAMDRPEVVPVVAVVARDGGRARFDYTFTLARVDGAWQVQRAAGSIARGGP